jgi:hypothetical protein
VARLSRNHAQFINERCRMRPFEKNFTHHSQQVTWGGTAGGGALVMLGQDLSSSTFTMTFAASRGATPDITLTTAALGSEGISDAYDASYRHPDTGGTVGATTITPQIDGGTLAALAVDPGENVVLYYDLIETPASGLQRIISYGTLTLSVT